MNNHQPAFPMPNRQLNIPEEMGLSKREYFAAAVIQGFCANSENVEYPFIDAHGEPYRLRIDNMVKVAVWIADAMIKELGEPIHPAFRPKYSDEE